MAIEFHREGPWALPNGWVWVRLGYVTRELGRIDPARQLKGQFTYIDLSAIDDGKVVTPKRLPVGNAPSRARQPVASGDTLLSCVRVYLRNNAMVPPDLDGAVASTAFCVLRPTSALDPKFLFWFIHSRKFTQTLIPLQRGNSPPAVLEDDVRDQWMPIAPLAEQQRIVARLDELFTDLGDGETALALARDDLDTWRRALLKAAVTGELTHEWRKHNQPNETGADVVERLRQAVIQAIGTISRRRTAVEDQVEVDLANLPELPGGWCWSRIGEVGYVSGGLTKNPARAEIASKLPFLRVANVQYGKLDLAEMHEIGVLEAELDRVLLQRNDVLIVEGNGSVDQIGRCAIWTGEVEPCIHQNHLIKARFFDADIALWAFHWLMSPHGRHLVTTVASSTSGLHTLSISKIQAIPVPVPPFAELQQILNVLSAETDAEGTVEIELAAGSRAITPMRQAVLKAAFEGSLVDQNPLDEPADSLLNRLDQSAHQSTSASGRRMRRGRTAVRAQA
jgi:type I restriction enzyme S subunit